MQLNFKVSDEPNFSKPHKEPLIILHGLFGTLDNWQTLARQWSEDYVIFTLDMRNHGRSPFADTHTYDDLTADLLEFMQTHNIACANLLGHSMGGKAAMHFAVQQPQKIQRLIIVDIAPKNYGGGHEGVFEALFAVDLSTNPSRQAVEQTLRTYILNDNATVQFLLKNLTRNAATTALEWKINIPVLYQYYHQIVGNIALPDTIDTPTLFIRGGNSLYIKDADWSHITDVFTNVQLATVPNAGHWVHAENPSGFSAALLSFLV
jgi:pimeloyl-ACP methyl ester carboxylesterase